MGYVKDEYFDEEDRRRFAEFYAFVEAIQAEVIGSRLRRRVAAVAVLPVDSLCKFNPGAWT